MKLTRRQGEIAELAALGLPNKTIARQLGITEGTVKLHMQENLCPARESIRARCLPRAGDWIQAMWA